MDEESVKSFTPTITPEGIAGLWLQQHIPTSDRKIQVSLGKVIVAMQAEGMRKGKIAAIEELEKSPTVSAAIASLEADIIKLNRIYEESKRG